MGEMRPAIGTYGVKRQANLSLMDRALTRMETKGSEEVKMMEESLREPEHPTLGAVIDTKA
ncbi:hypothetical protein N780_13575 [Pontibacillus chungwhensis BH030062]|uniref:Uncharacterized protein n=1 Tax=Pontibacillus chungwhensis BH030062 TaxID=1385513 RepID=A0A0A2UWY9_9BACI|nr:YjfB family protein [Pontibacillus chungwhensis]KGP92424.1 hypothetical protein N780_13575 [Pontibacillus chungwhensis BH030062]